MVGLVLIAASVAGCTLKSPKVPVLTTGDTQEITWNADLTWINTTGNAMEEFTGEFDSGVVPTVTGSEWVNATTGAVVDVNNMINQRKLQSGDTSKLTEEDISLMEKIIQKIQNIGK